MIRGTSGVTVHPRILNVLAKQQYELVKDPPSGIIFHQNEDGDVLDIQADIIGPVQTPYHGGVFRCKLVLESGFPQNPPKGFFLTKIFHPNVAVPSGDICVNTLKRDWNPAKWSLKHIFEVIKCLLIVPFPESSLNEEAGRQFMEDYDSFCNHAKVYTEVHARPSAAIRAIIEEREEKEALALAKEKEKARMLQARNSAEATHVCTQDAQQATKGSGKEKPLVSALMDNCSQASVQQLSQLEENKEEKRPQNIEMVDLSQPTNAIATENSMPVDQVGAVSLSLSLKPKNDQLVYSQGIQLSSDPTEAKGQQQVLSQVTNSFVPAGARTFCEKSAVQGGENISAHGFSNGGPNAKGFGQPIAYQQQLLLRKANTFASSGNGRSQALQRKRGCVKTEEEKKKRWMSRI